VTLFWFFAAFLGGALNSVAGGGSFITLPALMYSGSAPVAANATSTFAMWPASLSSVVAYRREIVTRGAWLALLAAASLIGGLLGGFLLISHSDGSFLRALPWLMQDIHEMNGLTSILAVAINAPRWPSSSRPAPSRGCPAW
jgi:uncharacterized membrane protein YfcA